MKVSQKSEKPAYESRTVQLNMLFAVLASVAALDPALFGALGPKGAAVGALLIALANVLLRFRRDPA